MSICVADVLKLPSMRGARVLGGARGLSRIVSSVSVLEYAEVNGVQMDLIRNIDFVGNELAITGFMNNPDDVELQCVNIQRMAEVGEVGLILFYVGVVMKRVDARLIELADQIDFPLICMPEGRMNQRYSEVICEVMELIHRDQMSSASLVTELLDQAASLPAHQRTVDSMLRILADRLHASVVLMDSDRRVLNEAAWPRALSAAVKEELIRAAYPPHTAWGRYERLNMNIYRDGIQTQDGHAMDMLIFKEGEAPDVVRTREAVEVVQLAVSIWSGRHDRIVVGELVRAILQDEPLKMRRLADIFHVDIASINSMWILSGAQAADRAKLAELADAVRRDTQTYSPSTIADVYDGALVVFMTGPGSMQEIRALTDAIVHMLKERGVQATLTRCHALNTTTRVREAFLTHQAGVAAARKIFPGREVFSLEHVAFARQCQERIERGEGAVEEALCSLGPLRPGGAEADLLPTLECFLLDAEMSVTRAAERLYLHKNTVKYRLQRIADALGFIPGSFPETMPVYASCALNRLLRRECAQPGVPPAQGGHS